jgi:hypothetical protein
MVIWGRMIIIRDVITVRIMIHIRSVIAYVIVGV